MAKRSRKKGRKQISATTAHAVGKRWPALMSGDWFWGSILFLAVILAYGPVWQAGFIWDDDIHVTSNPCIVGPLGLKEIWTTGAASICPLVFTTFWLEHALWGLAPLPYHLVNVLQHGVCVLLLWQVLRYLQVPGAWLGAGLWALHPLQVESVAWISEMKNTQSCLFYLLTILFFLKWLKTRTPHAQKREHWNYALTLLFAALALTSKFSTVVLPAVLGLCAWWVEGRWHWRNVVRLAPIIVMSMVVIAVILWPQTLHTTSAAHLPWAGAWPERMARAGDVIAFYLGKLLWPHPLMMIYPRWQIDAGQWVSWLPSLAVIALLVVLWWKRQSWARPYFFALAYFLVVISPFLGLIDQSFWRYSFVEDHLQYLAGMGPLALAGVGLVRFSDLLIPDQRWLKSGLGAGLLLVLGILSWQRARVYENETTLWTDTLVKNPGCWVGYNNLGSALMQAGRVDEAIGQFQEVLVIDPDNAEAYYNLGIAFSQTGRMDEAIADYRKTLEIAPGMGKAHDNLGIALAQEGEVDEAVEQFHTALLMDPNNAEASYNLGLILAQMGRVDEAIAQFQKTLLMDPNDADLHTSLGTAFFKKGQTDQAIEQYQKALALQPDSPLTHTNLGVAFNQKGRTDEAIAEFQEALRLKPDDADAQNGLAQAQAAARQGSDSK